MVWGCISYEGVGQIAFIDTTINSEVFINIIAKNLKASAAKMGLTDFYFQQDGARCHTSKVTMAYFEREEIKILPWAAQSPDLNPIEHVWQYMKVKLDKNPAKIRKIQKKT